MEKPDVDQIDGLSPAISIDQKGASRNPRSTVGTVTEIYDYLRLLFARIGRMHCPVCGREIERQTVEQMVDQVYELPEGTRVMLMAPLVRDRKGEHEKLLAGAKQAGFVRVRVDGELHDLDEEIKLDKKYKHSIEVVVDRLVVRARPMTRATRGPMPRRMADSIETALRLSEGTAARQPAGCAAEGGRTGSTASGTPARSTAARSRSRRRATSASTRPHGACPDCTGLGSRLEIDPDLVLAERRARRSTRARSCRGAGWPPPTAGSRRSSTRWPSTTASGPMSRSATCRTRRARSCCTATAGERVDVRYRARQRQHPRLQDDVRGDHPEPDPTLPRDRLGGDARPRSSAT